ncbi:MAG: DUF1993 domain-containing protein [Deltaproteobacteria bacterium]|nr:DUF1993 domain-containing protein [Deltaproteobacteria bacterium]
MSHAHAAVAQLTKMLNNLDGWLEKAVQHAQKKGFDPAVLLETRLSPDMFPLRRQIQAACDGTKFLAARLAGVDAPKHADGDQPLDELRARIRDVVAFTSSIPAASYGAADERVVGLPFLPGKGLSGADYLHQMALPNTYFHIVTAYAILRHSGVDLGKVEFIGALPLRDV